jgi:methionyl-tRNA formyltransferase
MLNNIRYIYAGNRSTVLRRMLKLGLNVTTILPTKDSHLDRESLHIALPSVQISKKEELTDYLIGSEFDIFVSTGCKFILPISHIKYYKPDSLFINIHPSYLPDLRGSDPIPGAILYKRDSGVTCHHMDDGIDTGEVISQKIIKYHKIIDCSLLYNLCFKLEPHVFEEALKKNFKPIKKNKTPNFKTIYYSFKKGDNDFRSEDTVDQFISRVKAFNTSSKGFRFNVNKKTYRAFNAEPVPIRLIGNVTSTINRDQWSICMVLGNELIVNKFNQALRLSGIQPLPSDEMLGKLISSPLQE